MEVYADYDVVDFERGAGGIFGRSKQQGIMYGALPCYFPVGSDRECLRSPYGAVCRRIGIWREHVDAQFGRAHDSYLDVWLFVHIDKRVE